MTIASDNAFPKLIITEGSAPASPSAGQQKLYIDSADHKLKRKNSSGTVTVIEATGSGVTSGTSFPGGPAAGDLYFRTDLGLLCYYDGTRWLTVNEYQVPIAIQDVLLPHTTNSSPGYTPLDNGTYDIYCTRIICSTNVLTTNNGTSYWTVTFTRNPSATSLGSFNTSADTAGTATRHDVTVGALLGTSDKFVTGTTVKTSTPGNLYVFASMVFRRVIT